MRKNKIMKKIDVYMNVGAAPSSLEIVNFPPKGINYIHNLKPEDTIKYYQPLAYWKRKMVQRFHRMTNIPRIQYVRTNADIIFTSRGVLILNRRPWTIDVEHASSFFGLDHAMLNRRIARSFVESLLSSRFCRKIMPHCEASRRSIFAAYKTKCFEDKIETVYLAERPYTGKTYRNDKGPVRLLFIGRNFHAKGGKEVLQAYAKLKKKYDVELVMKCNVPQEYRNKYRDVIYIDHMLSREELFRDTYAKADIFVFPSFTETFGVVNIEAMSTGLPVIATDVFAGPEIIEDGKGGFLIRSEISWSGKDGLLKYKTIEEFVRHAEMEHPKNVSQIVNKVSILIENRGLRKRMGRFNRKRIEKGRFSIEERNNKYKRIFEEALRY